MSPAIDSPRSINGVSLVRRDGQPKSRYSTDERLQMLGATWADLHAFIELFCPGRPIYAATKTKSGDPRAWTTPDARLIDDLVVLHLIGDMVPGIPPRWIAPRSWETTLWIGLDVDFRGHRLDFRKRCAKALRALQSLGVSRSAILESETPSGGRHYRFFLDRKVKVEEIADLFAMVGITETPGEIEIFPKRTRGMRLPFGHIPGKAHDPSRFVNFIRAFQRGQVWRVSWHDCQRRALEIECARTRQLQASASASERTQAKPIERTADRCESAKAPILGVPKRLKMGGQTPSSKHVGRYLSLLGKSLSSPEEANELWTRGILAKGTRTAVTKRLAWHLLVVRKCSVSDATALLTEWVYRTGKTTSHDVEDDLRRGTRKVAAETARIVAWTAAHRKPTTLQDRNCIAKAEVDSILKQLGSNATDRQLLRVALNFLRFVKINGKEKDTGWSGMVAVRGVIRRWPGCDGMKYLPHVNALRDCGLIQMTQEKVQSANGTGKPRTYQINVLPPLRAGASMTVEEALEYAMETGKAKPKDHSAAGRGVVCSNTYMGIISPAPGGDTRVKDMEARQAKKSEKITPCLKVDSSREARAARFRRMEAEVHARLEANRQRMFRIIHMPDGQVIVRRRRPCDVPSVRCQEEHEKFLESDLPRRDRSLGRPQGPPDPLPTDRSYGDSS